MTKRRRLLCLAAAGMGALALASVANAEATRTWVSGLGDDANPCSRTAPCKTWAGAISKTAIGGEIDALDPGGYGALTITKSITIVGKGTYASVLSSGSPTGFNIDNNVLGTTMRVVVRHVAFNGAGTTAGTDGIRISVGSYPVNLTVEDSSFENFANAGFTSLNGGTRMRIHFTHCMFENNTNYGFIVGGSGATASVDHTVVTDGGYAGFAATSAAHLGIIDSTSSGNAEGVVANNTSTRVTLDHVLLEGNNSVGIHASGNSLVRVSDTTIVNNTLFGLLADGGAAILTRLNNTVEDNGTDGTFNGTYGSK